MSIRLERMEDTSELSEVLFDLAGIGEFEAYRFCDEFETVNKQYDVFKIVHDGGACVLKRFDNMKRFEAEKAICELLSADLPVPRVIACKDGYMLTEFIEGSDLKVMTDEGALAAARSVSSIFNAFPLGRDYDRTNADEEISYREKRLISLENEPVLHKAYELFLQRFKLMPLTLANGDFLPINCIYNGETAVIIDWEYVGFMQYALDLGRFLAHSGDSSPFLYRMSEKQKAIFVQTLYDSLNEKPEKAMFERDIKLAVFDECVMVLRSYFDDPTKQRSGEFAAYYDRALALANELV
ncbi:MAG: phosphotransferase [Clostridia bacterium]|nr:phosphotransferase [Clostridia bacterium]